MSVNELNTDLLSFGFGKVMWQSQVCSRRNLRVTKL